MEIINQYKESIDVIISESDEGIYDAMNKGLNLAKGEYICFLNADDIYVSNTLSYISEMLK
ncbi:glycosyl transferase, partial [Vibrio parahaemolyticus]